MLVQKLSWITVLLVLCQHGVEAKRIVACEGTSAFLRCHWGSIRIMNANYGRTDDTTCPSSSMYNLNCFSATSHHAMSVRCDGNKSCSVPAVNSVFGDPCYGTYKYLDVSYECQL
ncbi:L-rhamnose-binding lectin CSL3-like [Megalobrama amblycephala]|uniref:L-rhamnose-binding lectin CSL3-like n=1 Tax=Megalobrama amblycephala TaxID=75352 RepID=UPI002013D6BE|nr:L-rhamnose-binding lectin CSL3-like [Megalobrama amblycephala]